MVLKDCFYPILLASVSFKMFSFESVKIKCSFNGIVVPPVVAMKSRPSVFGVSSLSISVRKKELYDIELVQVLLFPFQNIYFLTPHPLQNISSWQHSDTWIIDLKISRNSFYKIVGWTRQQ